MRKIRCPRCAVINMEGFTTFPYCAACGTHLPETTTEESRLLWRRPLSATLWATVVGLGILAVALSATRFFDSRPAADADIVLHGRAPRNAPVGAVVTVRLMLDQTETVTARRTTAAAPFTLRVPANVFRAFRLQSIRPAPQRRDQRGNAYYFYYTSLSPDAVIQVRLVPLRPGAHQFVARVFGRSELHPQTTNQYRTVITAVHP